MRANRLIHAITVSKPGSKYWDEAYKYVKDYPSGRPFHILLSYYYIRSVAKTLENQVELIRLHREHIVSGGRILIDSGIFTFKNQMGLSPATVMTASIVKSVKATGIKRLKYFRGFVKEYITFLRASEPWWDYAIDFDADPFVGGEIADEIHEDIAATCGFDRDRIVRVYHIARDNVNAWWRDLCEDSRYSYVAIEAGATHRNNPEFFRPLIREAHKHGKIVHILGIGSPNFLRAVPVDTVDTSSHLIGGQFGRVLTPFGRVTFCSTPSDEDLELRSAEDQEQIKQYWKERGITVEDLRDIPYRRALVNIWYMNEYWDVSYVPREQSIPLFDILET